MAERLDIYEQKPYGMDEYLANYGFNFSKKMCEFAVSRMTDRNGAKVPLKSKEQVDAILRNNGVTLENDKGYNAVYVAHMAIADFLGSSISDEAHLAKYVKDVIDDKDGYDGMVFTRFYADCMGSGEPIFWDMML